MSKQRVEILARDKKLEGGGAFKYALKSIGLASVGFLPVLWMKCKSKSV